MKCAQHKLADCFADSDLTVPQSVRHLHLGNAATRCGRGKVGKTNAGNQATDGGGNDGPPYPAMPRGGVGTINQQSLKPHDAQVEGYGSKSADPAG